MKSTLNLGNTQITDKHSNKENTDDIVTSPKPKIGGQHEAEQGHSDLVMAILTNIQETLAREKELSNAECYGWANIFKPTPATGLTLVVGMMVAIMQQITGIETVMYYQPQILLDAGIRESKTQLLITFATGLVKLLSIFAAGFLVDNVGGRRSLLMGSHGGCMLSLLIIGIGYTVCAPAFNVAGLFLYVTMFSLGSGPVTWLYLSEIFPYEIRARAMSLAATVNRFFGFIIALTFLSFSQLVGSAGVFYFYAGVSLLCVLLTYLIVPEVKGLSLKDVAGVFKSMTTKKTCAPCLPKVQVPH